MVCTCIKCPINQLQLDAKARQLVLERSQLPFDLLYFGPESIRDTLQFSLEFFLLDHFIRVYIDLHTYCQARIYNYGASTAVTLQREAPAITGRGFAL